MFYWLTKHNQELVYVIDHSYSLINLSHVWLSFLRDQTWALLVLRLPPCSKEQASELCNQTRLNEIPRRRDAAPKRAAAGALGFEIALNFGTDEISSAKCYSRFRPNTLNLRRWARSINNFDPSGRMTTNLTSLPFKKHHSHVSIIIIHYIARHLRDLRAGKLSGCIGQIRVVIRP